MSNESRWPDLDWWESEIDAAIAASPSALCNLRITLAHYELSRGLSAVMGPDTGANFHTWAVWGSKKAGETIRREDIPHLTPLTAALGAGAGSLASRALVPAGPKRRGFTLLAGAAGGIAAAALGHGLHVDAARRILAGNVTVLDDIGRPTARFVATFLHQPQADPDLLSDFLTTLRPGPTASGGQDLLARAYSHYYRARYETDRDARHEHMLLANYSAILHEHIRLQPYINGAMPGPLRRLVTAHLLEFELGDYEHEVGEDVEPWQGAPYPQTLAHLADEELVEFLSGRDGWDRTPNDLAGSRAADWSNIRDRMNYIVDLFRSRHLDPGLFSEPFTPAQTREVLAGNVPRGHL